MLAAFIIRAIGIIIALMMEAASTSFYRITRRNNPEDSHLHFNIILPSTPISSEWFNPFGILQNRNLSRKRNCFVRCGGNCVLRHIVTRAQTSVKRVQTHAGFEGSRSGTTQ
jgi:hypothetical protein